MYTRAEHHVGFPGAPFAKAQQHRNCQVPRIASESMDLGGGWGKGGIHEIVRFKLSRGGALALPADELGRS